MANSFLYRCTANRVFKFIYNGHLRNYSSLKTVSAVTSQYSVVTDVDLSKVAVLDNFRSNKKRLLQYEKYIEIKMMLICDVGIDAKSVANFAADCKEIFSLNPEEIMIWIDTLISHSFHRDQVAELVKNNPWLLLIPIDNISKIIEKIVINFQLTRKELPLFCINAPCILADTTTAKKTTDKYNYFYFIVCHRNLEEIVTSGIFKFPLDYLKLRYEFLHRRGQFSKINRHFQTRVETKPLTDIYCTTDQDFCVKVAECDLNELNLFKKCMIGEEDIREREEFNTTITNENTAVEIDDVESETGDPSLNAFADELTKHL